MNNVIDILNDWIRKNDTFKKKFKVTEFKKEFNKYIIYTEKTTNSNIVLLKKLLPSFLRYLGEEPLDVIFANNTLDYGPSFVTDLITNYIESFNLKPDDIEYDIQDLGNNIFKLKVRVNPKSLFDLKRFEKIKVSNDKFLNKSLFPSLIRKQIIVDIDYTDKIKNLLTLLNQRWNPSNEFDKKRNVKFLVNSLYSSSIIVLTTQPDPTERESENQSHPYPANSDYFHNMRKLNSEIRKYLKMWGIESDQIFDTIWGDSFKRTSHPYIIED